LLSHLFKTEKQNLHGGFPRWFSIFYNAIIGSYVAFLLVFLLVKRHGATASSLPGYVMPIASTIMGALLLGELITLPLVLGCLIIFIGIFFAAR